MNELHLFAGAGGGILGGQLLGHRCVCAVEWEPYAQAVLVARQNDGTFPPFPIWDDVQTFDGKPWCGIVDVVCGGFPCQDISAAGKGAGITGERSGMWSHMARIIGEVRPRFVFVENSPMLTGRGLGTVLGDLASMGFDARWGVLGVDDINGLHERKRIWILAYTSKNRRIHRNIDCNYGEKRKKRNPTIGRKDRLQPEMVSTMRRKLVDGFENHPDRTRIIDDVANWSHRLAATGNGQVPIVAATAWRMLAGKE